MQTTWEPTIKNLIGAANLSSLVGILQVAHERCCNDVDGERGTMYCTFQKSFAATLVAVGLVCMASGSEAAKPRLRIVRGGVLLPVCRRSRHLDGAHVAAVGPPLKQVQPS